MKRTRKTMAPLLTVICTVVVALSSKASVYTDNPKISFFGKLVVLDDSTHIMQQITEIVESDTMLSISGIVLTVGKVGFGIGIDIRSGFLSLLSSTQVDDPKMKEVLECLSSIYGTPYENEPDDYWWQDRADDNILGWIVRMRPFRSEEGGTVLFFRN